MEKTAAERKAWHDGYQEALRDVLSAYQQGGAAGAERALNWIMDNALHPTGTIAKAELDALREVQP